MPDPTGNETGSRAFAMVTVLSAVALWLAVIVGTYIISPPYRATPPPGTTDLSQFPRALVLANPSTAWLHAFAMEIKEHMRWIASMLTTAVAFIPQSLEAEHHEITAPAASGRDLTLVAEGQTDGCRHQRRRIVAAVADEQSWRAYRLRACNRNVLLWCLSGVDRLDPDPIGQVAHFAFSIAGDEQDAFKADAGAEDA